MVERKGRPHQPRCDCGKALYKRPTPGPVKPVDPYAWCRNTSCVNYGVDQSLGSRFKGDNKNSQTQSLPESPEMLKARSRIKAVVMETEDKYGKNVIGLALAIVSQELGSHDAANTLISEYNLTEKFGILPRGVN